jgi:hypothetical protein
LRILLATEKCIQELSARTTTDKAKPATVAMRRAKFNERIGAFMLSP